MPKINEQMRKIIKEREQLAKKQYKKIANKMAGRVRDRTRQGQGSDGKLANLAPSTQRTKRREGKPQESRLTDEGQMLDSLVGKTEGNEIIVTFNNDTASQKAIYAREGSTNRPKREFLKFSSADLEYLKKLITEAITKG